MKKLLLAAVLLATSASVPAVAAGKGANKDSEPTSGLCTSGSKWRFLWYVCW